MGEQMVDCDSADPFRIVVSIIKTEHPLPTKDEIVQLQTAQFDQSKKGDRSDGFGHARNAEQVGWGHQLVRSFVCIAKARLINELTTPSNRH